jgi:hypothetical protein
MNELRPSVTFDSPDWKRFEDWLAGELLDTYRSLANIATTEDRTQQLRGRAAFIDTLLSLGQPLSVAKTKPPVEY